MPDSSRSPPPAADRRRSPSTAPAAHHDINDIERDPDVATGPAFPADRETTWTTRSTCPEIADVNKRRALGHATYHPDPRGPVQRLVLEVDSAWHGGPLDDELDAERQADLEVAGERVLRTTAAQAVVEPRRLVRRLAHAGAPYTDRQP